MKTIMSKKTKQIKSKTDRVFEIDFVRGMLIIFMCLEHLAYYFYRYVFLGIWDNTILPAGVIQLGSWCNYFLYESTARPILRGVALALFFLVSGIASTFSKSNVKRATKILSFFVLLYILAFVAQNFIQYPVMLNFGVFLAYAFCILLFELFRKIPLWLHYVISVILLALSVLAYFFFADFGINPLRWFGISQYLNLQFLDDYPIFPSIFFFSLGVVLGKTIYKKKKNPLYKLNNCIVLKPVLWVGRNSLIVYGVHFLLYPIIFVIVSVAL